MPTDRARISSDPSRDYRSVVTQQGRVTLEADVNEQNAIASEALRLETIDMIGPCGTPDNGYEVAIGKKTHVGEIVIRPGTMYVGGWRLRLLEEIALDSQPDWTDQPGSGGTAVAKPKLLAQPRASFPQGADNELIALLVIEQDVTAVEDQALREVALGGPDTAARTRLMQHIIAVPTRDSTCTAAAKDLSKELIAMGLVPDPKSAELTFDAGLSVSFFPPAPPADPCCPPAAGGYLGADNQLVRVTVTDFDPALRTGTLLWGWNNASFLYRASIGQPPGDPVTLTLSPAPVDAAHTPQPGQVVEVLRTTCVLGDAVDQNYVAAPQGVVIPLGAGSIFDPDANQLTLPTGMTLPPEYLADTNPLFVRLWQAQVPFTHGKPAQLDAVSGVAVTIEMKVLPSGPFLSRPFWNFAVRPNTPQEVYPERYLERRQGPTGPRLWLCDLAIVSPGDTQKQQPPQLIADCRLPFLPLTGLDNEGGCCGITLGSAEVTARGGLQAVVDAQARKKQSLSLRPGTYTLAAPLKLTRAHAGFILGGCGGVVRLQADPKLIDIFQKGLIEIVAAQGVSLEGLTLMLPLVPRTSKSPQASPGQLNATAPPPLEGTLVGLYADNALDLTVKACEFLFTLPAASNAKTPSITFGSGIFAQGLCAGMRLERNVFVSATGGQESATSIRFLLGLLMVQASAAKVTGVGTATASGDATTAAYFPPVNHTFDNAEILDNEFDGMTIASLVVAQLGRVRCAENLVRNSAGGLWFLSSDLGAYTGFGRAALAAEKSSTQEAGAGYAVRQATQPVMVANASYFAGAVVPAQTAADQAEEKAEGQATGISTEARGLFRADYKLRGSEAFRGVAAVAAQQPPGAEAGAGAATTAGAKAAKAKAAADAKPVQTTTTFDKTTYTRTVAAYGALESLAVAAEITGVAIEPVLSLRHNDISLVPGVMASANSGSDNAAPGILVLLAQGRHRGALFLEGNRVEVPNVDSFAAASFWAADTVITGNLFTQVGTKGRAPVPCAYFITDEANQSAIMANVIHSRWFNYPPRTSVPATDTWEFLNTVR